MAFVAFLATPFRGVLPKIARAGSERKAQVPYRSYCEGLQASPRQRHGPGLPPRDQNLRLAEVKGRFSPGSPSRPFTIRARYEAPRVTAVTGAKTTLNDRLRALEYSRAAWFRGSITGRHLVGMVIKADARVFATSKKARSHFSEAIC